MKTNILESAADYLMSQLKVCETKEDLILAFWFYWVESVTTNSIEFAKVVACAPVNKWFMQELKKDESDFRDFISNYPDTKGNDKDWLYCKCISKLMSRFPKVLLYEAKKREQKQIFRTSMSITKLN
ncbi:hypothetical protein NJT12_00215 [Flavobacterium sp. AC]|uniref:Uncharacterized protein n=1 Tax=Flavobacterium azizsancarii TaxID=2961580 RepID=A0ABT4W5Z4_9FLAO|nr:hypothetical protein [Flavobacterium azizsancarii]MDA6068026.1 hypothetical protein [Flavobacterium azizsancarii]